jgi:hypothetical protein
MTTPEVSMYTALHLIFSHYFQWMLMGDKKFLTIFHIGKFLYCVHKGSLMHLDLSQLNPVHDLYPNFINIHFNTEIYA